MQNELVAYQHCPLCSGDNNRLHKAADCSISPRYDAALSSTINWMICEDCSHQFRSGYYTPEALSIVFKRTNQNQMVGYDIEGQRRVSSQMIEKILPYQDSGRWLDVGFGNGSLLFTAEEYGFYPVGLDLRPDTVASFRQIGMPAYCQDVMDHDPEIPYAVVSMADVLEHMPYPKAALKKVNSIMEERGALFLSMPNADCFAWKVLDQLGKNPFWSEIEHYHNFGRRRLYKLLEETGFQVVRYGISERYRLCMEVVAIKD